MAQSTKTRQSKSIGNIISLQTNSTLTLRLRLKAIFFENKAHEQTERIFKNGRGEGTGVKLHVAGWVSWHAKCDKLEFYNNEQESTIKPQRHRKPRTRKYRSPRNGRLEFVRVKKRSQPSLMTQRSSQKAML